MRELTELCVASPGLIVGTDDGPVGERKDRMDPLAVSHKGEPRKTVCNSGRAQHSVVGATGHWGRGARAKRRLFLAIGADRLD